MHRFLQQKKGKHGSVSSWWERHICCYFDKLLWGCDDNSGGWSLGLYQDIQWISSLGYHNVIFELDCKMVVDDVHNSKMNLFEYGSII